MEKYIWRMLTAIFMIAVAVGVFLLGFVFSGGRFNNPFSALSLYVMLFLLMIGIAKGILVVIDYHRAHKDEE